MRKKILITSIITLIIFISGCYFLADRTTEQVVREYSYNASSNLSEVTINIYKEEYQNLTIQKINSTNVTVIESFYLQKRDIDASWGLVEDYVRFSGNDTNLLIKISLAGGTDKFGIDTFDLRNANVSVTVFLPEQTNYTVNNVDYFTIKTNTTT